MQQNSYVGQVSTGISGLDQLLSGGLPINRSILVMGGPGSGKSILCSKFLMEGITKGDPAIYLSLDYSKKAYLEDMKSIGLNFQEFIDNGKFKFIDCSSIRRTSHVSEIDNQFSPDELTIDDLVDLLKIATEKNNAKRIVIDDLTSLVFRFHSETKRRNAVFTLINSVNNLGVTSMIISEAEFQDMKRRITPEEYLVDGVINLFMLENGTRGIQISKMRGVAADNTPRPYSILGRRGIEVFSENTIFT